MAIPTELVGSLPRPMKLQEAYEAYDQGQIAWAELQAEQDAAAEDSIRRLEEVGEPIVTDGEQRESSFATYPITDTLAGTGLADNLAGDGQFFAIFDDGHHRQLPRLTGGPFRYKTFASEFVEKNKAIASGPVKQAVIAPSMLMLLYPLEGELEGYSREQFLDDLCDEVEKDIRAVLRRRRRARLDRLHRGPAGEQERLAQPLDQQGHAPGVHRPQQPRDRPLQRRGAGQHRHPHLPRRRLRLRALQGSPLREAAEQDVPAQRGLLPDPVRLRGRPRGRLPDVRRVLAARTPTASPQVCFMGVINPLNPEVETAEHVRDELLLAAKYIPVERLGATDDCGFSPFSRDVKPKHGSPDFARDIAMQKIAARLEGARLARRGAGRRRSRRAPTRLRRLVGA